MQAEETDLQTPKPTPRTHFSRFLDDEFGEPSDSKAIERVQEIQAIREIHMPPFDAQEVEAWFMLAESNFVVFDVRSSTRKYHLARKCLPLKVISKMKSFFERDVPAMGDPYAELKKAVLDYFRISECQAIEQMLHGLTLGSQRPSELLETMRTTAQGRFADSVVEQLWISKLPIHLKPQLRMEDGDLAAKGAKADRGVDTLFANQYPPVNVCAASRDNSAASSRLEQLLENQNRLLELLVQRQHQSRPLSKTPAQRNPRRDRSASSMRTLTDGVCGYHNKFKEAAFRCAPGCQFQKN
jgi:hypothetical protein